MKTRHFCKRTKGSAHPVGDMQHALAVLLAPLRQEDTDKHDQEASTHDHHR